jgi:CheY-like chemotaxis protein/anti-sigma regulatory factor (Ser/Thr protein kinase)
MPIILVVDDSPVDRLLAGRLLGKEQDLDWVIEYASNGREALAFIQDVGPDAVVTDLMMPEMDGLQLVTAVREQVPQLPVVLVTGQGSEELAVEALARGAASYVPKGQLADKLLDTVKQVMTTASADRGRRRLADCITEHRLELQLENDPALIAPLVDQVQQLLTEMAFGNASDRRQVGVAVEEALLNAFCHGTLQLSAEQAQEARSALSRGKGAPCVDQQRALPSCRLRHVTVTITVNRTEARFVIRDEGAGFIQATLPERHDPTTLERGRGRGLVLMRNFMDEVKFNITGNEVTMVKRRPQTANA